MAYELNRRLFVEDGAAIQAADALSRSSSNAFRAWRGLDSDKRFAVVEDALKAPANDLVGFYPIAL